MYSYPTSIPASWLLSGYGDAEADPGRLASETGTGRRQQGAVPSRARSPAGINSSWNESSLMVPQLGMLEELPQVDPKKKKKRMRLNLCAEQKQAHRLRKTYGYQRGQMWGAGVERGGLGTGGGRVLK